MHSQVEKASSALRKALDSSMAGKLILVREAVHQCRLRRSLPSERQWLLRVRSAFDHFDRRNTGSVNLNQFANGLDIARRRFLEALRAEHFDVTFARPNMSVAQCSDKTLRKVLNECASGLSSAQIVGALFRSLVKAAGPQSIFPDADGGGSVAIQPLTPRFVGDLTRMNFCRFFGGDCPALPRAWLTDDGAGVLDLDTAKYAAWVVLQHFFNVERVSEGVRRLKADIVTHLRQKKNPDDAEKALLENQVMAKIESCDVAVARKQVILETEERMLFTSIESFRLRRPVFYVHPIDKASLKDDDDDPLDMLSSPAGARRTAKMIQTPAKPRRLSLRDDSPAQSPVGSYSSLSLPTSSPPAAGAAAASASPGASPQRRMSFSPSPRASATNGLFQRRLKAVDPEELTQGAATPTTMVSNRLPATATSTGSGVVPGFTGTGGDALSVAQTKQVLLLNANVTSLKREPGSKLAQKVRKSLSPRRRKSTSPTEVSGGGGGGGGADDNDDEPDPYLVIRRCVLDPASLKKKPSLFAKKGKKPKQPWRWEEIARTSSLDSASLSDIRSWKPLAVPLESILGHHDEALAVARFRNMGPALSETLLSLELEVFDARNDWSVGHTRLSLLEVLGVEEMILLMAEHKARTSTDGEVDTTDLVTQLVCQLMPQDVDVRRNVLYETDILSRKKGSIHGGLFGSMMVVKETSVTSSRRRHMANVRRQIRTSIKERQNERERLQRLGEATSVAAAAADAAARIRDAAQDEHQEEDDTQGSEAGEASPAASFQALSVDVSVASAADTADGASTPGSGVGEDTSDFEPEETVEELLEKIRASIYAARPSDVKVDEFERMVNDLADAYDITDDTCPSLRETRALLEERRQQEQHLQQRLLELAEAMETCARERTEDTLENVERAITALPTPATTPSSAGSRDRDDDDESGTTNTSDHRVVVAAQDAQSLVNVVREELALQGPIGALEELLDGARTALSGGPFLAEDEVGRWVDRISTASQRVGAAIAANRVVKQEPACMTEAETVLARLSEHFHFQRAAAKVRFRRIEFLGAFCVCGVRGLI